jgi:2-oxoglutarate ferredoxin oxidoreductase subunit gamma
MMSAGTLNIQFCGFGGQGVVLAAVIFGTTAVTRSGLEACQTQSYGSEARGGECQAQVIVSRASINSPLCEHTDLLVGMSRQALEKYLPRLRTGGTVVYDPGLASLPPSESFRAIAVPATGIADQLGTTLAANMVMLGFLQTATGLFTEGDLLEVISENVPPRFRDVNVAAARRGMELARENGVKIGG